MTCTVLNLDPFLILSTATYFSESCAPGSEPDSNLCKLCKGGEAGKDKCKASNDEPYYGYSGAFRYDTHHYIDKLFNYYKP